MSDHKLTMPLGYVEGTAVIRDKDGNIKATFNFGGPATEAKYEELKEAVLPKLDTN